MGYRRNDTYWRWCRVYFPSDICFLIRGMYINGDRSGTCHNFHNVEHKKLNIVFFDMSLLLQVHI
jgi:hypothetical protein